VPAGRARGARPKAQAARRRRRRARVQKGQALREKEDVGSHPAA
jgi:hypothetical protein